MAGILFDVLLEVILLHLLIADVAVMDDYALDAVLSFPLNFGDIDSADQFFEQRSCNITNSMRLINKPVEVYAYAVYLSGQL